MQNQTSGHESPAIHSFNFYKLWSQISSVYFLMSNIRRSRLELISDDQIRLMENLQKHGFTLNIFTKYKMNF